MISDDTINETMSYEERLGKIGSMIAHEFGHAIDANGCYFDENGISKSWWTSSDFTKFSQRVNKVKNYFNGMDVVDDVKINGDLIKSEAMADLTSMMCCLELLKNKEDVNYKTFFESYAKMYKQVANQEYEKYLAMVDSHLPSSFRVNHIINQFEEFYTTYGIKEGDKMYIEPEDRINIF